VSNEQATDTAETTEAIGENLAFRAIQLNPVYMTYLNILAHTLDKQTVGQQNAHYI
jgi:hypothetical protein